MLLLFFPRKVGGYEQIINNVYAYLLLLFYFMIRIPEAGRVESMLICDTGDISVIYEKRKDTISTHFQHHGQIHTLI